MASVAELVKGYRERIQKSTNKTTETRVVLSEIDKLVYESNDTPISASDKLKLIQELRKSFIIVLDENFSKSIESRRVHEATDNSEIIKIITEVETKMKGR